MLSDVVFRCLLTQCFKISYRLDHLESVEAEKDVFRESIIERFWVGPQLGEFLTDVGELEGLVDNPVPFSVLKTKRTSQRECWGRGCLRKIARLSRDQIELVLLRVKLLSQE